jgi:tetratricopeptide (TPR) repeat protein
MMRWLAIVGVLLMFGCRPDDQRTETIDAKDAKEARAHISPELATHLDSGNAAYKTKDYARAREHYRAVTRIDADAAAGWFGIYMVEQALGNAAAADSALERARKRAPGATIIHPK